MQTYDAWKSRDSAAECGGDGHEDCCRMLPARYWLRVDYDRGLHVTSARLLKLESTGKGWELVSEQIVAGRDDAGAVRALRESRAEASAWSRARRIRELKARGEFDRRVPTWV